MTRRILFIFFMLSSFIQMNGQVTIGSAYIPNKDALLDLKQNEDGSSEKGLLIARVALEDPTSPAPLSEFVAGMTVYNTSSTMDLKPGFYYSDGTQWVLLEAPQSLVIPTEPWLVVETDEEATLDSQDIYHSGEVIVGRSGAKESSASLEVYSDTQGFLLPRLSKIQRDAITNPTESLIIWNIDEGCFNFYAQDKWKSMCGDLANSDGTITSLDCEKISFYGTYQVGTLMDASNYLTVTITVPNAGNLKIEGVTDNGFYFQKVGTVSTPGTYTYAIPAFGTPDNSGPTSVTMVINDEAVEPTCTPQVTVQEADVSFSLNCESKSSESLIIGSASVGKTMTINVNVIKGGKFNFYTDVQYGVQYSAANIELSEGSNEITLYANGGIPTKSGTLDFTVSGSGLTGDSCIVPVEVLENIAEVTIDCDNIRIAGTYVQGTALTASNYIEIKVQFTQNGTWSASTDTVNGITFNGSGNAQTSGSQMIRIYGEGTPDKAGNFPITININGKTCVDSLDVIYPTRNILLVGSPSGAKQQALSNGKNFGPVGTVKINGFNIYNAGGNPNASQLKNAINTNKIDIIIAGWWFSPDQNTSQVIADFINKKKGYYFQAESQGRQTYLQNIIKATYGLDVQFTSDYLNILVAKFTDDSDTNQPFLHGPFGDVLDKYVMADDNNSWIGMVPSTGGSTFNSLIQLPNNGNPARNIYSFADGFFMNPDYGSLSYTGGRYGYNTPIALNDGTYNGYGWNGSAYVNPLQTGPGTVANWVLFGNVMDYIIQYVQENIEEDVTL